MGSTSCSEKKFYGIGASRPRPQTSTTTRKTTTTTEEDASDDRSKFANQRNRIRQRLRTQFNGGTSAAQALEILNNRAKVEQKEKVKEAEVDLEEEDTEANDESEDESVLPKVKKDRTKLNVTKAVDRRNELFKKRVPITHQTPTKDESTASPQSTIVAIKASSNPGRGSDSTASKPLFANPARRPFKISAASEAITSELTATESSSTQNPESESEKPGPSVRCRLFRRACTDDDLKSTKS